jgi:hypothetical protein
MDKTTSPDLREKVSLLEGDSPLTKSQRGREKSLRILDRRKDF